MKISNSGSVRVDLTGGTLDLAPINLIIPSVVTLNIATSLKADVEIEKIDFSGIEIVSHDYGLTKSYDARDFSDEKLDGGYFGELTFIALLLKTAGVTDGVRISLKSGSPPGAGLGGSSAMGVTIYSLLCTYKGISRTEEEIISIVNSIEDKILNSGPAGYQDYYPALFGGVLALIPGPGCVKVEQLYSNELKNTLENNLTLVFSGESRHSGINNWEVYKQFFDGNIEVREGLTEIAKCSRLAYESIKQGNYSDLVGLIAREGSIRDKLFPGITTNDMKKLLEDINTSGKKAGMKVCGAGGGGCFLITHQEGDKKFVSDKVRSFGMNVLDLIVEAPL